MLQPMRIVQYGWISDAKPLAGAAKKVRRWMSPDIAAKVRGGAATATKAIRHQTSRDGLLASALTAATRR